MSFLVCLFFFGGGGGVPKQLSAALILAYISSFVVSEVCGLSEVFEFCSD